MARCGPATASGAAKAHSPPASLRRLGPASRPKRRRWRERIRPAPSAWSWRRGFPSISPMPGCIGRCSQASSSAFRSRRHTGDPRLHRGPQVRGRPHRHRRCHGRAGRLIADHQYRPLYASPPAPACPLRNADDRNASSSTRADRDPVGRRISEARPQVGSRLTRGTDALYRRRQYAQGRPAHRDSAGGAVARLRACRQFRRRDAADRLRCRRRPLFRARRSDPDPLRRQSRRPRPRGARLFRFRYVRTRRHFLRA